MSAIENISPSVIKRISKELNTLVTQPPEGIRVIVNELDVCDVQAWILGPESTPYEGGCFRVKLVLGADFPAAPPKCYFITKIFHPNVSKSGEVCVNTLKKDWNKDSGVERILLTVKCLLIVPNPESALNEEAGKLLLENYEDYAKHARMMTKIHAQNKSAEFSSNINNSSTTSTTSTTTISSTTTTSTSTSTSSPKKFVSSQMTMKTTPPQTTTSTTTTTTTTNNSNMTNSINNSSITNITALIAPLTVSNSMNESKSNAMNGGGYTHLKKNSTSMSSNDNQLASNNPTVTPKKRAGDKKLDKKQVDKKRSLKRL